MLEARQNGPVTPPDFQPTDLPRVQVPLPVRQADRAVVVAPQGAVDLLTAPRLESAVAEALAARPSLLVIDLTGVEFLASIGLTVLVKARRDADRGTALRVVATGAPRRAISVTGLDDALNVYSKVADAMSDS
jgi:anti-sigma B factor antagonist